MGTKQVKLSLFANDNYVEKSTNCWPKSLISLSEASSPYKKLIIFLYTDSKQLKNTLESKLPFTVSTKVMTHLRIKNTQYFCRDNLKNL